MGNRLEEFAEKLGPLAEWIDVAEISRRTGIAPRRLRYVIDHEVFKVSKTSSRGRGTPRTFSRFEAFGISCAALLLNAGLRQSVVRECMKLLSKEKSSSFAELYRSQYGVHSSLLGQLFTSSGAARVDVGDGVNVRIVAPSSIAPVITKPIDVDSGWRQVSTRANLIADYAPLIILSIDAQKLRERLGAE